MNEDMILEVLVPKEAGVKILEDLFDAVEMAVDSVEPKDRDWDFMMTAGPASGVVHIGHGGGHRARGIVRRILADEIGADDLVNEEIADKIVDALIEAEKL